MYALFQLLSKTETMGGRLSHYFEERPPSLKTASRIEQYRRGLPQMKVALRALLSAAWKIRNIRRRDAKHQEFLERSVPVFSIWAVNYLSRETAAH
jgi:hypothetical protein